MNSDDFFYVKENGLMFYPITISHDECVSHIIEIVDYVSPEKAVKAFLSSLSIRRLDWRSGIFSYYIAKLINAHKYKPVGSGYAYVDGEITAASYICEICKNLKYRIVGKEKYVKRNLDFMNFDRIKRGGAWDRHKDLLYILFDLEQFIKAQITEPTETDINIFKNILDAVNSCNAGDLPSVLSDKLKNVPDFKSNKNERSVIVEILACMEVLKPASYDKPIKGKHDWVFAECWRGEDGYDAEAVDKYFGKYLY